MTKTKKAILFGTSGQAQVFDYLLTHDSEYQVVAFCCSQDFRESDQLWERPLVDFETIEKTYPPQNYEMHIAIGYAQNNHLRERFYNEAKAKGYKLLNYISSKSTYWGNKIGDNVFIFEDNTIQPFVNIGSNVVIWSGNHIGHHSTIESHCFISSHVVVSGHCHIGHHSFLGVNSTLKDGIKIAPETILGAGSLIVKDTESSTTYIGHKSKIHNKD